MELGRVLSALDRYGLFNTRLRKRWSEKAPTLIPRLEYKSTWNNYRFVYNTRIPIKYCKNSLDDITDILCREIENIHLEEFSKKVIHLDNLIQDPWEDLDYESCANLIQCQLSYYETYKKFSVSMYHYLNSPEMIKQINNAGGRPSRDYQELLSITISSLNYALSRIERLKGDV